MTSPSPRLVCIDRLRGLVLILMVLDHIRDFMQPGTRAPELIPNVEAPLFLTRFATHFCAPVFFMLAGMSAFFYRQQKGSQASLVRFLISRGLWLVFLELTVVHGGWHFTTPLYGFIALQVIWALGWSMVLLGMLCWLPTPVILVASLLTIGLHHFIPIPQGPATVHPWGFDWMLAFLHGKDARLQFPSTGGTFATAMVIYPLLPWVGVMGCGFAIAPRIANPETRRQWCYGLGASLCILFVALRFADLGLDPNKYEAKSGWIDFLNTSKYPPSFPYLAMTLGPAFIALGLLDWLGTAKKGWLLVFGRVPLFFYITHIYFAHLVGMLWIWWTQGIWLRGVTSSIPAEFVPASLAAVYGAWFLIVAVLYWPCLWFMRFRQQHRDWWWLSYL